MISVIKKDGTLEPYDEQKIINAVNKSALRENFTFTKNDYALICNSVLMEIEEEDFDNDAFYTFGGLITILAEKLKAHQ